MKYLIASLLLTLLCPVAGAKPLKANLVEADLGDALGFRIFRFEAELAADEVLVIREVSDDHGKVYESEWAVVGSLGPARYQIVLVDSGAFHPSLRNSYTVRSPGSAGVFENKWLKEWGHGADGSVAISFSEIDSNEPTRKLTWSGTVENYSDVVKRWPDLPKPRAGMSTSSRRFLTKS